MNILIGEYMGLNSFMKKDKIVEADGVKIAFGVFGSSIRTQMKEERWSGQAEYYKTLKFLVSLNTISKVYVVGRNDIDSLSLLELKELDPKSKIVNCQKEYPIKKYKHCDSSVSIDDDLDNQFKYAKQMTDNMIKAGVKIDFGLFFTSQGIMTASALPGYLKTITGDHRRAKVLEMTLHYGSPLIDFVNRFNIPWFMFATDPRYVRSKMYPRDFSNLPKEIIGQFNEECSWHHVKEYVDRDPQLIDSKVNHTYSGIEKINIIGLNIEPFNTEKIHRFTIVSAQVDGPQVSPEKDFRFQQIKTWILDKDINNTAVIYGSWDDNRKQDYPQFKGFISTEELDNIFRQTKYSLVLPTKAGWATSKPWELLGVGVIPFFHSHYDIQNNMIPKDHFLRCKNAEDFYEKMDYLDANDDIRLQYLKKFQEDFILDCPSGDFFKKIINERLKKYNLNISI